MGLTRALLALIISQIGLHSCMAGVRMAAPLQALRQGHAEWAVGVLLGLFAAAPIVLALHAGRLADRHGYHRPMRMAVGLTVLGGLVAVLSTWLGNMSFLAMCPGRLLGRRWHQSRADRNSTHRQPHGARRNRAEARVQLAGAGTGPVQRGRAGAGRVVDRCIWLPVGLRRAVAVAVRQFVVEPSGAGGRGGSTPRINRGSQLVGSAAHAGPCAACFW